MGWGRVHAEILWICHNSRRGMVGTDDELQLNWQIIFLGFCSIYFIWGELSRWTCTTWSWQVHGVDGGILLWYVGRSLSRSLVSAQRIISKTELCGTEITLKISRWAMICLVCTSVCCRCLCRIATCYFLAKELMIIYDWQIVCATLFLKRGRHKRFGSKLQRNLQQKQIIV